MTQSDLVFLLLVLPLGGAAFAAGARLVHRPGLQRLMLAAGAVLALALPWVPLIMLAGTTAKGLAISGTVGGWAHALGIEYRFDGLALLITMLGMLLTIPPWIYSRSMAVDHPIFDCFVYIQSAFLAAAAIASDLFNIFVCMEVLGIASYVLIFFARKPQATLASLSYLFVSAASMLFYLLGVYVIYLTTGSLSFNDVAARIQEAELLHRREIDIGLGLMVSAIALRVAVVPVYGWLPDAHAMAPHPVSAMLSGVLIKTPLFVLLRLVIMFPEQYQIGRVFALAGAATALLGVVLALAQSDAKRLLAYHSVSQIGYVVTAWGGSLAAGITTPLGIALAAASWLHALLHGIFKGTLFLATGAAISSAHERNVYVLRDAAQWLRAQGLHPLPTILAFAAGALSITALPPWSGFISKNILVSFIENPALSLLLLLASVGTVASFLKLARIFLPNPGQLAESAVHSIPAHPHPNRTATPASTVPLAPAAQRWVIRPHPLNLALLIGALLCLVGGIAGPALYQFSLTHISGWIQSSPDRVLASDLAREEIAALLRAAELSPEKLAQQASPAYLYAAASLLKTLWITLAGGALFLLLRLGPARELLHRIESRQRSFSGLFLAFFLGAALLALSMYYRWP
ncbi:MAG: proton-conducting transporter membrane subunit [Spirochaetaceae bacterium]|nr:proton-conducting transporter membrane subunit [Spirochaetaceae bacterium]